MQQLTQKSDRIRGVVENPSPDAPGVGITPLVLAVPAAHRSTLLSYSCHWEHEFGIRSLEQEAE